ncbi:hypothetical protein ACS14E_002020 [Campylobacter coli]
MLERLIEIIGLFIFTLMMLDFRLFLVAGISAGDFNILHLSLSKTHFLSR